MHIVLRTKTQKYTAPFRYRYNTEANLQAEFYMECRKRGHRVVLNFYTPVGYLDAACLSEDGRMLKAIVEVKRSNKCGLATKQLERYRSSGVRVFVLRPMDDLSAIVTAAFKEKGRTLRELAERPAVIRSKNVFNRAGAVYLDLEDLNWKQ